MLRSQLSFRISCQYPGVRRQSPGAALYNSSRKGFICSDLQTFPSMQSVLLLPFLERTSTVPGRAYSSEATLLLPVTENEANLVSFKSTGFKFFPFCQVRPRMWHWQLRLRTQEDFCERFQALKHIRVKGGCEISFSSSLQDDIFQGWFTCNVFVTLHYPSKLLKGYHYSV